VNSTLGLLVFPQQEFVDRIPETPLSELERDGWPMPKVRRGADRVNNLNQLIRYLRNAIAHFNIEFVGDGRNQVSVLRVWNETPNGVKTWEAELSVTDLRGITERFIRLLLNEKSAA
jgi:HEPN pEK499 p136